MKKINLSLQGILGSESLEPRYSKLLDRKGKDYTLLVDIASEQLRDNLDWWMSVPASRSPFMGDLYQRYCQVLLIKEILSDQNYENLEYVEVDSNEIKKCVQSLKSNLIVEVKKNRFSYLKRKVRFLIMLIQLFKIFILKLSIHLLFKVFRERKQSKRDSLIIIDTFVFPGYVDNDRYYNGLIQSVPKEYLNKINFVPTIVLAGFNEIYSIVNEIRNSSRPFLLKEDLLTISDLASSFLHYFSKPAKNSQSVAIDHS